MVALVGYQKSETAHQAGHPLQISIEIKYNINTQTGTNKEKDTCMHAYTHKHPHMLIHTPTQKL